ncbi:MAG TPA: pyrroline-5-carboxylate reductase, partial [Eubacteriaceae bacterium]|nr:pyrroline-5-carboxylate reductase [Eubacteriaceae bacterium]
GGTTIEMITALEGKGFRNAVIQGVVQAAEKSQKMRDSEKNR